MERTIRWPDDLEIRRVRADEIDESASMWQRSQRAAYAWFRADQFHPEEDALRFFRESVCTRCDVFVAVSGGGVLGVLALEGDFIEHLYVRVDCWGRGIGSRLLDHAVQLHPLGLSLVTLARNQRARELYERRGFTITKTGISPSPENEPDVWYAWRPVGAQPWK